MTKNDFNKIRSCAGCINASFNLYIENLSKIFKVVWKSALTYSIFIGIASAMVYSMINMDCNLMSGTNNSKNGVTQILAIMFFFIGTILLKNWNLSTLVSNIKESKVKHIFLHLLNADIFTFAYVLITTILSWVIAVSPQLLLSSFKENIIYTLILFAICVIVGIILYIPFIYTTIKYSIDTECKISFIWKKYSIGLRNFGSLFKISTVVVLMMVVIGVVAFLPIHILTLATLTNAIGVMNGDASAMPNSIEYIIFAVSGICSFVMLFIIYYFFITLIYACGSIEAKKQLNDSTFKE